MEALLVAIVTWLSTNFELPASYDLPTVQFASRTEIASARYGVFQSARQGSRREANTALPDPPNEPTVSAYDDRKKRIMLPAEWRGRTPAELSVLVHEVVHHLQNQAGLTYACSQEREALAYKAQEKRLGLFGRSLLSEFQMDGMTLLVKTKCFH